MNLLRKSYSVVSVHMDLMFAELYAGCTAFMSYKQSSNNIDLVIVDDYTCLLVQMLVVYCRWQ